MTRKDFVFIAETIASMKVGLPKTSDRHYVACAFAARLIDTNPRFDSDRFLKACGVNPRITAKDVNVTVGHETIECAALVDVSDTTQERVRFRYSGYTKKEAVAAFVAGVNSGDIR